ncbi:ribonuclease inhibitor-like [Engraulis encrasicolus]|uniref:ribonuclease inhibitor-like n=1 Tax=Engraulis encrasicolus TaxID=184585 RepID=UPI002FD47AC4
MDLDNNKLGDSGVKQISNLLKNPDCKLQTLGLSGCGVTEDGYAALASALKSNPSHLEELDLRGNDPGDSGVELLTSAVTNQKCKLRLLSDEAERACEYLTSVLGGNPLLLTELDLSWKTLGDSGVKQLCPLLKDSHCRIKTLGQMRLVCYRIVLELGLQGETLGREQRRPLPSCVVRSIRGLYPSESDDYVGFQEVQEAMKDM